MVILILIPSGCMCRSEKKDFVLEICRRRMMKWWALSSVDLRVCALTSPMGDLKSLDYEYSNYIRLGAVQMQIH